MTFKKIFYQLILFIVGAIGYPCIELLYRAGNTHWTMAIVGGIAFLAIIDVNYIFKQNNFFARVLFATLIVTFIEFISGLIINKWCGLKVWDYTACEFNVCGQICLKFSMYWSLICAAIILIFDILLYFKQKKKQ